MEDEYFKRKSAYESAQAELKVVAGKRAEAMKSLNQIALVFEEIKQVKYRELAERMKEAYRSRFHDIYFDLH